MYLVVLLACCGRVQFDELAAPAVDAALDVAMARLRGVPDAAPPTITLGGQTFEYTSFNNTKQPVGLVQVMAFDAASGVPLASGTSAASGAYSVEVMTGGMPRRVALRYALTGYFTTTSFPDLELAASVAGGTQPVWTFGDAPVWSAGAMASVYATSGVTRDDLKGTLNVAVRDCAGAVIDGVSVDIVPAPGALRYQAMDGLPSTTLTATVSPYGRVLALNAEPGVTRVTAIKAGRTFLDTEVTVLAGSNNTLAIVRAVD